MGQALPAIPEFRARGHAQWHTGSAPIGVAFLGRTSTGTLQDPVVSLARQHRGASERLPDGFCIVRCYWDVESGGIDLDARSQDSLWRTFAAAGIPRDGGMAELRAAITSGDRPFSAVICEDINRAGRDMLDSLRLEKELRAAGVLIFATSEPIDVQAPAASTMLVRRMRMAESEYFRYNLKTMMWEGLQQYAISGHNTGPCPYGYLEDRTPHPNPLKASMAPPAPAWSPTPAKPPGSPACSSGAPGRNCRYPASPAASPASGRRLPARAGPGPPAPSTASCATPSTPAGSCWAAPPTPARPAAKAN